MPKTDSRNNRLDHAPGIRREYERHKKRILATQSICGICGQPVDKKLKYPDPFSPTIDHIIPISKGGHPSALENLQLAHFRCNRMKFNQAAVREQDETEFFRGDRGDAFTSASETKVGLPWTIDWKLYHYDEGKNESNSEELFQQAEGIRRTGFVLSIDGIVKRG